MADRIRYAIFFVLLCAICVYYGFASGKPAQWWLLWPALTCGVLAIAYGFVRPSLVCGKTESGRVSPLLLTLNLPWLAFTWIAWLLTVAISREPSVNPISGTNVSISRYPLFGVNLASFDRIFDLTSEFPRAYSHSARYHCFPTLDGVALSDLNALPTVEANEKVLIHCAQGHGRSATFASLLLARNSAFSTPEVAHLAILEARPGARISRSQQRQLNMFSPSTTQDGPSGTGG